MTSVLVSEGHTSPACCAIPPVQAEGYEPKGEYKAYGGFAKAYITGPKDTGKAIVEIYDIFCYSSQTLQAADILAHASGALLVMPDVFEGITIDPKLFGSEREEDKKTIADFLATTANVPRLIPHVHALVEVLRADGYSKVGAVGYCFGGKVVTVSATSVGKIDAIASAHPGRVAVEDAEGLACPIAFFPSKDENEEICEAFYKALESKPYAAKNVYKRYSTMHHGWAGARANLADEENLKEYSDVLKRMAAFYKSVWAE